MKIYETVIIDMATMQTISEVSYEYHGPVAQCKGGGGGTTTVQGEVDYEYNRRMAAIAEQQQAIANEYFNFWKQYYMPMEIEQIAANRKLIPLERNIARLKLEGERELIPLQTGLRREQLGLRTEQIGAQRELLPYQTEVTRSFLQEAKNVNPVEWMGMAQTDVAQSFANQRGQLLRQATRLGLSPDDPRLLSALSQQGIDLARMTAGARTAARRAAEAERFRRLGLGSGIR